jgi:Mg2+ and Co2+ transporter CorA
VVKATNIPESGSLHNAAKRRETPKRIYETRMAIHYSTVLSGLMDARGTIINNNMNVLLKNLTIINVVFLPLTFFASIGGMSEYSMMTQGIDWRIAYPAFILAMSVLGLLIWWWVVKMIDRSQKERIC